MLLDTIQSDLITAQKTRDTIRVDTLRFLLAAIKKFEIDTYLPGSEKKLNEEDVCKIIQKQIKQHKESIAAFESGNRQELAQKEQTELDILQTYVPKELTDAEIEAIVTKITASGVTVFGQVMGMVMKETAGRAGGERVSTIVKRILS